MKIEYFKSFIEHGIDKDINPKKLVLGSLGVCALTFILGIFGISSDLKTNSSIILSAIAYLIGIVYFIGVLLITNNLNFKKILQCNILNTVVIVSLFCLFGFIFLNWSNMPYLWFLIILPFLCGICSFLIVFYKCKKDKPFKKNNPLFKNLTPFVSIGVFIGFIISKSIDTDSIGVLSAFIGTLLILVASIFAIMGTPSILKLFYFNLLSKNKK